MELELIKLSPVCGIWETDVESERSVPTIREEKSDVQLYDKRTVLG